MRQFDNLETGKLMIEKAKGNGQMLKVILISLLALIVSNSAWAKGDHPENENIGIESGPSALPSAPGTMKAAQEAFFNPNSSDAIYSEQKYAESVHKAPAAAAPATAPANSGGDAEDNSK